MNQFEYAIQDIFNVPQFVEYMQYGEQQIKVIAFSIDENGQYTEFGFDPNISFYLTVKKADFTPEKNIQITFRNVDYRIDSWQLDSYGLTYKIYLKNSMKKPQVNNVSI